MDYLALYRKYRPSLLNEMVGQNEIKQILTSSIKNKTISHAYLFSGPRGTGKTTTAKILAKMVNCEHPVDGVPCNKCNSCINLFNTNDVIEIDAASNNGVDEIRDLREKANLVPSSCKYKVYIIDEVHMLTNQAFNALLKTLEEPPKHVIFILATTEYHKIPLTIASRCQKFQFNKIDDDEIVDRLSEIAKKENINISNDALMEIAKISDGGMRDSINYLDQVRSFSQNTITIDDVVSISGNVTQNDIEKFLFVLKNNDVNQILLFLKKIGETGKNYGKFLEDLLEFLDDVLLYKKDVSREIIKSDYLMISNVAKEYSVDELYKLLRLINNLFDKLKNVSKQQIFIVTNFLLYSDEINCSNLSNSNVDNDIITKSALNSLNNKLDFTENNNSNECTSRNTLLCDINNNTINSHINDDIIINNAFALASKSVKAILQEKWKKIDDFLTDKKFSTIAGKMADVNLEVASNNYLIFSGNYEAIVDYVYFNYNKCNEFVEEIFSKKYNFVVVTLEMWNKCKIEYINNIKNGIIYKEKVLKSLDAVDNDKFSNIKETAVDKLFDIIGEDNIEFK